MVRHVHNTGMESKSGQYGRLEDWVYDGNVSTAEKPKKKI
jgi:hypothetical protein